MPDLKMYRIFISHAWTYNEEYYKLIDMLNKAPNFSFSNYSVPEHDPLPPNQLVQAVYNQIRPVQIVIVLSGMYVSYSDWIQKEMDIASELKKPIIGIKPWGSQRIPQAVQEVAKEMVGWNTSSIIDAIRKNAL